MIFIHVDIKTHKHVVKLVERESILCCSDCYFAFEINLSSFIFVQHF